MEKNELDYLKKTLSVVEQKIAQTDNRIKNIDTALTQGKKELSENYSDISRGGDLSEAFSSLADTQALADDLHKEKKRLLTQKAQPYFARIDFTADKSSKSQQIYIGIGNVIDNGKLYVADWRAPVSSLYYDYNLGRATFTIDDDEISGEITKKRQYKIEDGQLLSYFDTDLTINDDILQEILSHNASVKMRQIVSSIQKEQNALVRKNLYENMLIQGVAGSGKTSIALHRAAYLLYKHRKTIKSSDILIISPNNVFSSYISEVLPQLGEDNLVETTFSQIVRAEMRRPVQSRESMLDELASNPDQEKLNEISYKSSYEYLDSLLRFLKGAFLDTFSPQDLSYVVFEDDEGHKETIDFPASQTKELFFKTFKGLDLYERINKIAWQYARVFTDMRHYNKEQNAGLKERFKKILYRFLPIRDVEKVFEIFMAREGLKESKSNTIAFMDKGAMLAVKHFLYGFDHDFSAKYLIIDEMQDFTPVEIYLFKKLWNCPCIIVGDVNQCIEKNVSDEYLQITADFLGCKLTELKKTYRSTREIAKFANDMIGLKGIEFVNRSGDAPQIYTTDDQIKAITNIIDEKCRRFEHIAIICKCMREAKDICTKLSKKIDCKMIEQPEDYNSRILVTTCATAKGIEFDAVIIPNADDENYHNTIDKNILYVSSTRALHSLFFTTSKPASHFLKGLVESDR